MEYEILTTKKVKNIAYQLFINPDHTFINDLISTYTLDGLIKTRNRGLISNLLTYYISINNDIYIHEILKDQELMKRDYLNIIKYYYNTNYYFAEDIFKTKVISQFNLLTKDIDFIVQYQLFKLIKLINGYYIDTSIDTYPIIDGSNKLNYYYLPSHICKILLKSIKSKISFKNNLATITKSYDFIIDGGNILHSRNGTFNTQSIHDLINIINYIKQFGNPLLIIHQKHFKYFKTFDIDYYLTPYGFNDDLYIIWFFLNLQTKPFIISNDKYRDHIFELLQSDKKYDFDHIIHQQTLSYDIIHMNIDKPKNFSRCIQLIDDKIYIPIHQSTNYFIQI